ncbi:MAG: hypothetical protein C5B52_12095 [Bacteroidetes bacterium]|nr:MAG: hypothetical protein C5B52_12095 [Bacteroidota bacterium]
MNPSFLRELPNLIEEKIIDEETAQRIRNYYLNKPSQRSNILTSILTAAGALLAGLGIILIIAHNWDNLGSVTKTVFAFLPLILGQALCFYAITKKKGNRIWGEASAIFLFCAVGAVIALIGQIYHIDGTLEGFLLTWILLTLPLVYIVPSRLTALLCICCITWYASLNSDLYRSTRSDFWHYPVLMVLLAPFYYKEWKNNSSSNYFHFLNWFLVISILISVDSMSTGSSSKFPIYGATYLAILSLFYWVGKGKIWRDRNVFTNPFRIAGTLGILVILLWWSYEEIWRSNGNLFSFRTDTDETIWTNFRSLKYEALLYVSIIAFAVSAYLGIRNFFSENEKTFDPTGFTLIIWLIALMAGLPAGLFLINIWILYCGIYFVRKGALKENFGILNFGLIWIAILAICRFFDDSIPFVVRGLFFLLTGIAFFAGNYILIKSRKAKKSSPLA